MRFRPLVLILPPALLLSLPAYGQTTLPTASSTVSPALGQLRAALGSVRVEKWKAPGAVRTDAGNNLGSIRRDLDGTLPGLLATADAAPGLVSKNLPVFRNLDALYDVLLRVVESADLAAPEEEAAGLNRALSGLEDARRALGDNLQASAVSMENRLNGLRTQNVPAPSPSQTVVEDGTKPGTPPAAHKRKPAKATTPPAQ